MHQFIRISVVAVCSLVFTLSGNAQQTVTFVNGASFTSPLLPGGSIAQGSIMVGFAAGGMGPAGIEFPNPWPFPTELAGTSIQVTVGNTTVDCFMVFTSAGQVAAILPSNTPLGACPSIIAAGIV